MRLLIVGGTGVISSALSARLIADGHTVLHCNRGQRPVRGPAPAETLFGDRTDFPAFEELMAAAGRWDCVYDMVVYRPEEAASAIRAFRDRTALYVFCSTVDVYAKPARSYPITEASPLAGVSAYGIAKAACEALFAEAAGRGELPVASLRPAYTYGDGARGILHSLGFATSFLTRLRQGLPVIVHGDGHGLWAACHAADAAGAFAGLLGRGDAIGRAFNVVADEFVTWDVYVARIAAAMGWPMPEIVHVPTAILRRLAPQHAAITAENLQFPNVIASDRARAELGFRSIIPLEAGMRRTIEWLAGAGLIDTTPDAEYAQVVEAWRRLEGVL